MDSTIEVIIQPSLYNFIGRLTNLHKLVQLFLYLNFGFGKNNNINVNKIQNTKFQIRMPIILAIGLAGGILMAFGALFMLLALSQMVGALADQAHVSRPELALHTADVIISAALIIGGALLWRRQALGYVSGTGLLFLASILFVGLMVILLLQPLVSDAPFAPVDVLTILVMGLICFVPFGLFLRGVIRS